MPAPADAEPAVDAALLVADLGGTHARFGIWHQRRMHAVQVLRCADYHDLAAAAGQYLASQRVAGQLPAPACGVFAVATPLAGDHIALTNNSWNFSAATTRRALKLERLVFLNDFTALALAVPQLSAGDRRQVGGGAPLADGPIAVVGPGTGLGVSGLVRAGERWLALQSDGGHVTLPATTPRESAVIAVFRRQYPHVSAERMLCGQGLMLLYRTLAELDGVSVEALAAEEITRRAVGDGEQRCRETLAMFCAWLGNVAGNLALTLDARGGVYIGGGIVPLLGPYFDASPFRQCFEAKGRYAALLTAIPVYIITAENPALIGCVQALSNLSPRVEAG